jgi:hypothetical protein
MSTKLEDLLRDVWGWISDCPVMASLSRVWREDACGMDRIAGKCFWLGQPIQRRGPTITLVRF